MDPVMNLVLTVVLIAAFTAMAWLIFASWVAVGGGVLAAVLCSVVFDRV